MAFRCPAPERSRPLTPAKPLRERFWDKVTIAGPDDCWVWTAGQKSNGYGSFAVGSRTDGSRRQVSAHRFAYEASVGPIPDGLELDHLCRVPLCVNPGHLEPVTHRENMRRGNTGQEMARLQRVKTHCPQGHPYDTENTLRSGGQRHCRACRQEARRTYNRRVEARCCA